jgi:hypothetical protein
MDWIQYGANIVIVASSWMAGVFVARFMLRKFFNVNPDGPAVLNSGGGVSTDDVLDFDKAEMPYIPVKISREHGIYYAWFTNNDKFIGQAEKIEEIEMMAYKHLMKLVNLRMEFNIEEEEKVSE